MPKILGDCGPAAVRPFLAKGGYKMNDQGKRGESYSRANYHFDALFK